MKRRNTLSYVWFGWNVPRDTSDSRRYRCVLYLNRMIADAGVGRQPRFRAAKCSRIFPVHHPSSAAFPKGAVVSPDSAAPGSFLAALNPATADTLTGYG